jgi:hypothetical protein
MGGLQFEGSKQCNTISTNKKLGVVVYTCHPNYMGSITKKIMVQVN